MEGFNRDLNKIHAESHCGKTSNQSYLIPLIFLSILVVDFKLFLLQR